MLTLCLICLLPVCYFHLITCLSDQTLDSFLSPPIESWWNRGARWAWQLPTENLHVHQPDTIGIIIEGQPVVRGVPNLSKACCLLFGLAYLYCSEQVENTLIQCLFYIIVYMCGHMYWLFCSHCLTATLVEHWINVIVFNLSSHLFFFNLICNCYWQSLFM